MITYDKYKDSGIEWLGNIPQHWEVKRVKDTSKTQSGTTPNTSNDKYYENGIFNWIRTTDLNDGHLFDVEYKITQLALDECRFVFLPIDSILVAMYGGFGTIGKNSILKKPSTINQSVCAILPSRKLHPNYFLYFLKYFRNDWKLFADGTRKDPNINQEAIKNLFYLYPPLPEQIAIGNYLDTKTQAIDKKIDLLSRKAATYKDLRKSLINDTVCRGLDKNLALKDSGIEWIGQIPQHWEVKRLKDIFRINKSVVGNAFEDYKLLSLTQNGVIIRDLEKNAGKFPAEFNTYQIVENNDLIFCLFDLDVTPRTVGISNNKGMITGAYTIIHPTNKKVYSRYFYTLFLMADYSKKLSKFYTGLRNTIKKETFLSLSICLPPLQEQIAIANYLDEKTQKIDAILLNIQQQMDRLKELRKSLINDVVTGKIRVIE